MAYVRQRGNQLAIVQGGRDPESKKVEQEILFTLYSKGEALEAIGKRGNNPGQFRHLLESTYPQVKFNWKAIEKGIADNLEVLPDLYDYRSQRLQGRFREDLRRFTKQLLLADSQMLVSSAQLIAEHRYELEHLRELIDWRLETRKEELDRWNGDNPFYWRFSMRGREVPGEAEEAVAEYYERGDLDRAKAIFQLFTEMFDGYAEGHNYLGLIALDRSQLDEAIAQFQKTIELGRRLFPKKIAKSRYWQDHATRPYMRGLMNLACALNRSGRYVEALALCDRLEGECADATEAWMRRGDIYLNSKQWELALNSSVPVIRQGLHHTSIVAALAAFELGQRRDATLWFVHAAATRPRTVAMVLDIRMPAPSKAHHEVQDHNEGVNASRDLAGYIESQSKETRSFFRHLWRAPEVEKMRADVAAAGRRWFVERTDDRKDFDLFTRSETLAFAEEVARRLQKMG